MSIEHFLNLDEKNQKEILEAVIQEFAQYGYESASTNRIVHHAGISKGVLFKYFGSKEKLFLYACDYIAERRMTWLAVETGDLPADIFDILRFFALRDLEFIIREPLHHAFFEQVMQHSNHPVCQKAVITFQQMGQAAFAAIIDALPAHGLREGVTMADAMNMIHWVFDGFNQQMQKKLKGNYEQREDEITAEIDHVFDLLKYGIYQRSQEDSG